MARFAALVFSTLALSILVAGQTGLFVHEVTSGMGVVNFDHVLQGRMFIQSMDLLDLFGEKAPESDALLNNSVCAPTTVEAPSQRVDDEPLLSIEVPFTGLQSEFSAEESNSSSSEVQMVSMLEYVSTPMTWSDANEYCARMGAAMATVRPSRQLPYGTNSLLRDYAESRGLGKNDGMWLGLHSHDAEVDFYSNWVQVERGYPKEPNGVPEGNSDCVEMIDSRKQWRDTSCSAKKPFVCAPLPCDDNASAATQFMCPRRLGGLDSSVYRVCMSAKNDVTGVCEERCTAFCPPGHVADQAQADMSPIDEWRCGASVDNGEAANTWTPARLSNEVDNDEVLRCHKPPTSRRMPRSRAL